MYSQKPLEGRVVAVTRPEGRNEKLIEMIKSLGGIPYVVPLIEVNPTQEEEDVLSFLNEIIRGGLDLIVLLSVNSVRSLFNAASKYGLKDALIEGAKIIRFVAIGASTARELRNLGVSNILTAERQSTEGVLETLGELELKGLRVGMPRSSKADDELKAILSSMGALVWEFAAYTTGLPGDKARISRFIKDLIEGSIDAVTFTSRSIVEGLFAVSEEEGVTAQLRDALRSVKVASIGPKTKEALENWEVQVNVMPEAYSVEAMMDALASEFRKDMIG